MDESVRNEIVQRWQARTPGRQIARELQVAESTVRGVIARWQKQRGGKPAVTAVPKPASRARSLAEHEEFVRGLLERYPNMTAVRVHEELRTRGFTGSYTVVRQGVRALRPRPLREPVRRFETSPGAQAQMDYSTYDLDFTGEGRRRVYLFSYLLGYSRRQYLRFVERMDLPTTIREHVRAFEYLGGVAATCLYDNMKVVVTSYDGHQPLYNTRFLAFATHYGFQPWACRPRRPQTKGKIERPFWYLETNLLNGRTFTSLDHLNQTTLGWLAETADVRLHRETKRRPIDLFEEEKPYLLALPAQAYDTARVLYRTVDSDGHIAYLQNFYSVPWQRIGELLPVRVTENELIVYGPDIKEIARHELYPFGTTGQRRSLPAHSPGRDHQQKRELLRQRFAEFGPDGVRFFEELLRARRNGKDEAARVLALLMGYRREDLARALERACRYRAFSWSAVERILAAQAKPRSAMEALVIDAREHLDEMLRQSPLGPRSTADYQPLLEQAADDEGNHEGEDDGPDDSAA